MRLTLIYPIETALDLTAARQVGSSVRRIVNGIGCHVAGIVAGSKEYNCVIKELGFDACISCRDPKASCGKHSIGIDVCFDNVRCYRA